MNRALIMIYEEDYSSWFWHGWCKTGKHKKYKSYKHQIHWHFVYYCQSNHLKEIDESGFDTFVTKYEAGETLPDDLTEDAFVLLLFALWKKHIYIQRMLYKMGIIDKFIQIVKRDGYDANWPKGMCILIGHRYQSCLLFIVLGH